MASSEPPSKLAPSFSPRHPRLGIRGWSDTEPANGVHCQRLSRRQSPYIIFVEGRQCRHYWSLLCGLQQSMPPLGIRTLCPTPDPSSRSHTRSVYSSYFICSFCHLCRVPDENNPSFYSPFVPGHWGPTAATLNEPLYLITEQVIQKNKSTTLV